MAAKKAQMGYIRAYEQLKKGIIEGIYSEDRVFVETEVAEELGMSRTPVREAIRMLKAENLLVSVPGQGLMARRLKKGDIKNVYEVGEALEGLMAYIVAEQKDADNALALRESVSRMEEALACGDRDGWVAADREFHTKLVKLSGNEFLGDAIETLNIYINMIRLRYTRENQESRRRSTSQHREVCEAIAAGDADYARTLMQYHWRSLRQQIVSRLD